LAFPGHSMCEKNPGYYLALRKSTFLGSIIIIIIYFILGVRSYKSKKDIRIHDIVDRKQNNILMIAVEKNQPSRVKILLDYDFDVDYSNNYNFSAIDIAWNNFVKQENLKEKDESNQIILYLLKANSRRPNDFDYEKASKEVKEFVDNCESLPKNVDEGELRYLRKQNKINEPELHILILKSKSKIGNNDRLSHTKWKFIDEAFETLNRNDFCRKILKVAAEFKKLKIFFDFKHDSYYYLDPVRSIYSQGIIYEGGLIFIGAKYLNDDVKKFEVFGVLIHEMHHVAIYMTFMNQNCDPFPVGESANKTRFIDQVMVQCKKQKNREELVANVINLYNENCHISKIIAIVPQIEIQYAQNAKKFEEFQENFDELFNYSREVVEPELEKALPVLKILNDHENYIKYKELTKQMQVYILHSKINFQGAETTLNELISDDYNILELLTSENIRGILMRDENLEIGSVCKLYQHCEMLQRSLMESKICIAGKIVPRSDALDRIQYNKDYELLRKNVDQIRIEMKDSKFLLLSDYAGAGKTSFFKSWAIKLKENYKNMWISCINLRKYGNVFEKLKLTIDKLSGTEIQQILKEIVDCKSKFEEALFSKLFSEGKAILMLDGFDEICPQYSDLFMKIFSLIIKNSSNNEFWISTRPHHADKLQQLFKTPIYMFLPCKEDEILQFIEECLKVNKFSDEKSLKNNSRSIYNTVKEISSKQLQDFNQQPNILIIVLITELYIQNRIKIGSENLYSICVALLDEQRYKIGEKIIDNRDLELSIWDIHRVLALILIIEKDYENELGFKLEELVLMKRWKKGKGYWTSDAIQRYGFIIVDLNEDLRNSIYFVHNIFAEFFVASFLINSTFAFNSITDANDIEKIFKIVDTIVLREKSGLENLCEIFFSYIKSETITENFSFEEEIEAAINEKIQAIHNIAENEFPLKYFYNLSKLVSVDKKLLNKLWKLDQDQTIVEKILRNENSVNFEYFCSTVEWCFGKSWHKIFNISQKELITDEELENLSLKDDEKEKGKHYKNLIKLLDLIKIIFDQKTCKELYDKVNLNTISINEIRNIVISKIN